MLLIPLSEEFRNYLPAVYSLSLEAEGITYEHRWAKRFEAMGIEPEAAGLIAMVLPEIINGGSGKGKGNNTSSTAKSSVTPTKSNVTPPKSAESGHIPTESVNSEWKNSITQSRVNVRIGDSSTGSGLDYAWKKHGGKWGANKSHFTITKDELKVVLQSDNVVKMPVQYSPSTGNYIRAMDMGKNIGVDAVNNNTPTSIMTVITDKKGNLINTFPGKTVVR